MNKLLKLALVALVAAPVAASAEEAKAPVTVKLSGMVDAFYNVNLDQPQSYASATAYDANAATGFNLDFAKLSATAETEQAGLRLDLVFGPEGIAISTLPGAQTGDAPNLSRVVVQQAYATYRFGGLTLEAGRFVTPAGFEVFEAKDNWLYTKGLIFKYAVPTSHEGVRLAYSLAEGLTLTGWVANGSNLWDVELGGAGSPYKTGILNLVYAKDATTVAVTGFVSKVPGKGDDVYQLDAVATTSFGPLSLNLSGDFIQYAFDTEANSPSGTDDSASIFAIGASAKYDLGAFRVVGRVEYLSDEKGVRFDKAEGTELAETATSFTVGAGIPVGSNADLRAELRYDMAGKKIYGNTDPKSAIPTATLAAVAWF